MKQVYIVTRIDTTLPFTTREWVFKKRISAVGFVVKALQDAAELERAQHYAALEVTYTLDGEESEHLWDAPDCESLPIGTSDVSYPLHTFQHDFVRYTIKRVDVLEG